MAYSFDRKKYQNIFDEMFGEGARESHLARARELGAQTGTVKREAAERARAQAEAERILEAARKEAAKKERERKKKEEKEKADGRSETKLSQQNEATKFSLEQAGVDTAKKQSAFGKWANLDPDNNMFFDALDLISRPLNAFNAGEEHNAELVGKLKKDLKAGKISEKQYYDTLNKNSQGIFDKEWWKDAAEGLKGEKKLFSSDLLEKQGMEKGVGRAALGFGLDVLNDPLNLLGAPIGKAVTGTAKLAGKGASKIPGVNKTVDVLDEAFAGIRKKQKDLTGARTLGNQIRDVERSVENSRLYMQDKRQVDVAKAMMAGGKNSGARVGREMEAPLRRPPVDVSSAPNVMSNQAMMDNLMPGASAARRMDPLDPISRVGATTFRSVTDPLSNGFTPNTQQSLDWGRKGLLNNADEGADLGVFGQWGNTASGPQVQAQVERIITSTRNMPTETAAATLAGHPSIQRAAQTLIESNADVRKFAEANGIDIAEIQGYMAHFITKEGRAFLDEAGETVSDGLSSVGGNKAVMGRKIKDSVTGANRKMKKKTGVEQFFNPDAFVATAGGQQRVINYIAAEATKKQVLNIPGASRVLPEGTKARKGNVERVIDGKRYELTKGANEAITNFTRRIEDESMHRFWKAYDKATEIWKKGALFSLGFHARNFAGNNFNMYIAGMNPAELVGYHTKAMSTLEGIHARRVGRSTKAPKGVDKLYDEFVQNGLKGTGSIADFAKNTDQSLMSDIGYIQKGIPGKMLHDVTEAVKTPGAWEKTKAMADALPATSQRLGNSSDEASRFAMFMWAKNQGMTAKEAAEKVREVLFDYTDLTDFERKGMRRVAPFYTWLRKNSEFQLKSFAKSPERYAKVSHLYNNAKDNVDVNTDIMPDYMKDNMALTVPGTDKTLNLNLPMSDLAKMTNPGKVALDSLSPLLKVPGEIIFNQKTLNGAPIKTHDTQKGQMFGKEFEGLPFLPDGEKTMGMNGKQWEYLFENMFAPARNVSGAMEKQELGSTPTETVLNGLGGNLMRNWDEEGYQRTADYKEKDRLDNLKAEYEKDRGIDVQTKSELEKQGVYMEDDHRAAASASLQEMGYKPRQVDMLVALKNKVYNGNAETAQKTAALLQQMGLPQEVIDLVTSDYLDY
jgi:hypothetical protein